MFVVAVVVMVLVVLVSVLVVLVVCIPLKNPVYAHEQREGPEKRL